jgi:hypothetical protein
MTTVDTSDESCLFIVVNLEYASMGAGRCAAQASHAANQFTYRNIIEPLLTNGKPSSAAIKWSTTANGFGTQIVKAAADGSYLVNLVKEMNGRGINAELVYDPQYFVADGDSFHIVPYVLTAAFIFGDKQQLTQELYYIPLLLNTPFDIKEQFGKSSK